MSRVGSQLQFNQQQLTQLKCQQLLQSQFLSQDHTMKKRYVKRLVRKIAFFVLTIAFISLVTTMIVERRMGGNDKAVKEEDLDDNGDTTTAPFTQLVPIVTPRRPRPPYQPRNLPREVTQLVEIDLAALLNVDEDSQFQLPTPNGAKKDWHDYKAIELDKQRVGLGEHGLPSTNEEAAKELEDKLFLKNGFNGLLSDRISVNRSVPDVRKEECRSREYLAKLPTVSVVVIFFNEHFSTLLRTIYSTLNRSPTELLKEIILVDDGSEREELKEQLDDFIASHWPPGLVKVVRNPTRLGLIGARLEGAKVAKADVMVFFDSHIEVNYNWLPPLLEPIAINRKICTCPIIDIIDYNNFAYNGGYQEGSRGGFDWRFLYKQLPVLPEDSIDKSLPYRSPVMMGGIFAISTQFFWDLGGYDPELDIWGGEQYELSFKIWMCGGMLLDIPCSRVAHIFRGPMEPRPSPRNYNFVARNHKRVAEVWMDEYKQYVYDREPSYYTVDAGNLSDRRAIRERLKCKSFHWFMTVIAPDFLKKFPPVDPPSYAQGAVQNVAFKQYCLDTLNMGSNNAVGLYPCAENRTHPQANQFWELSSDRDLRLYQRSDCLDVQESHENATVWIWSCHNSGGNQFWYYDRSNKWLVHGEEGLKCMEAIISENDDKPRVVTNSCDISNERQRWIFGQINDELLDKFYDGLKPVN